MPPTTGDSPLALDVRGLTVRIDGRSVVDGVDLSLHAGERMALIGASGSGKSLTAGAVLGQLPPRAHATGHVHVGGHDVRGRPPARRPAAARVAAVFQDPSAALNPLVPIGTQLAMPLRSHRGLRGTELDEARTRLPGAVGIEDPERVLRSCAGELSGGQRQRVCIALALASRAGLLVADEPTTALDLVTQAHVVQVLREHTRDVALLFITHDIAVAAALCDRAVVLADGAVVEAAEMSELISRPRHRHTQQLVEIARRSRPSRQAADRLADRQAS